MPKLARHAIRLAVAAFALAALGGLAAPDPARAEDDPLKVVSLVTYRVDPDAGPVHVDWDVTVTSMAVSVGSYDVPLLEGATGVRASGPSGALPVTLEPSPYGPIVWATVGFGRTLQPGGQIRFSLSYDLAGVRSDYLLITDSYAYLPAVAAGDDATVVIDVPSDPSWYLSAEPVDCAPSYRDDVPTLRCRDASDDELQVAALVELTQPSALRSIDASVPLSNGTFSLSISYFPGEEAWARHIAEIATAGLPLLESLFGFATGVPQELNISESGRQSIGGYDGIFYCEETACQIGISPVAGDTTALHEFAHVWTDIFEKRWLAEGLAEFMSLEAAAQLGALVRARDAGPPPSTVDVHLDDWGSAQFLIGASEDQWTLEISGYVQSANLFETLESRIGIDGIQAANAAAAGLDEDIDSQAYLDLLEQRSGARLDDLFAASVFPPSFVEILEHRQAAREELYALALRVQATEFELPDTIGKLIDDWSFVHAQQAIDEATDAIEAYERGRVAVEEPRSLWERLGLWGKDPEGALDDAQAAFAQGEFARARNTAQAAVRMLDSASDTARTRVIAAFAVGGVIATLLVFGVWALRDRRREFGEE